MTAIRPLPLSVAKALLSSTSSWRFEMRASISRCSTLCSPNDGKTCPMYRMKVRFGPTTSTPAERTVAFAYSNHAAR